MFADDTTIFRGISNECDAKQLVWLDYIGKLVGHMAADFQCNEMQSSAPW